MNQIVTPSFVVAGLVCVSASISPLSAEEIPPAAFTTNCLVCHSLDQALVGPSLVEIAEIYPTDNRADFIEWCVNPGKKRDQMPQMPSMVHIPKAELIEIYDYIKTVTVGVEKVKIPKTDPYASDPQSKIRPRIERTFVPDAGPASIVIALPTDGKHNIVWDTDVCRLRYISEGEIDRWPYLRSNGNSLADVGRISYRETVPVFDSEDVRFKGYHILKNGLPVFVYEVDGTEVTESVSIDSETIIRTINATSGLPDYRAPKNLGYEFFTETVVYGETLVISHRAL